MTWFLEDPIPTIVLAVAIEIALIAALLLTGSRGALYSAIAVAVVAGLVLVVERAVVTNREQIEGLFDRAIEAVKAHDTDALLTMIDPQAPALRDLARRHMGQFRPQDVKITDVRVWLRKDQDQWFVTRYEARDLIERKH